MDTGGAAAGGAAAGGAAAGGAAAGGAVAGGAVAGGAVAGGATGRDATGGVTGGGTFAIVIAANDEAAYIDACLDALLAQDDTGTLAVTVAANACTDATEARVAARVADFAARGWRLDLLSIAQAGKINALNRADAVLADGGMGEAGGPRAYLDADVICDPELIGQLRAALDTTAPRYATGTLAVARARTWTTRRYAEIWTRLPFVQGGAVGAGLFAVNAAGRDRWGAFPDIISDDTYARLQFAPHERVEVPARYHWPMVEGFANLVRVRRRQDTGVTQIADRWPALIGNEGKARLGTAGLARLAATAPVALAVYLAVHAAVRTRSSGTEWRRGR